MQMPAFLPCISCFSCRRIFEVQEASLAYVSSWKPTSSTIERLAVFTRHSQYHCKTVRCIGNRAIAILVVLEQLSYLIKRKRLVHGSPGLSSSLSNLTHPTDLARPVRSDVVMALLHEITANEGTGTHLVNDDD